jgi:hypothetical protein
MATTRKAGEPAFNEVVIQGKAKVVRAFLSGLVLGSGRQAAVYYSYLDGVHHEGKAEKLAELVGVRESDCHVIIDADTAAWLRGLAKSITAETGLVVAANRRIRGASMAIRYEAFGQRYDDEILGVLRNLPAGLKLVDFTRDVRTDPAATGTAVYTPVHAFEARGRGAVTGRIDLLIAFRRRLSDYPLLIAEDIELKLA